MSSIMITDDLGVPSLARARDVVAFVNRCRALAQAQLTCNQAQLAYERELPVAKERYEALQRAVAVSSDEVAFLYDALRIVDDWTATEEAEEAYQIEVEAQADILCSKPHPDGDF